MMRTRTKSAIMKTVRIAVVLILSLGILLAWLCICVGSETSDRGDDLELYGGD